MKKYVDLESVKEQLVELVALELGIPSEEVEEQEVRLLEMFVDRAAYKALNARFPFHMDKDITDLEKRYEQWVLAAAHSIYSSFGYHNIRQYAENGLSVTMQAMDGGIPRSMLSEITPAAKAVSE